MKRKLCQQKEGWTKKEGLGVRIGYPATMKEVEE